MADKTEKKEKLPKIVVTVDHPEHQHVFECRVVNAHCEYDEETKAGIGDMLTPPKLKRITLLLTEGLTGIRRSKKRGKA